MIEQEQMNLGYFFSEMGKIAESVRIALEQDVPYLLTYLVAMYLCVKELSDNLKIEELEIKHGPFAKKYVEFLKSNGQLSYPSIDTILERWVNDAT